MGFRINIFDKLRKVVWVIVQLSPQFKVNEIRTFTLKKKMIIHTVVKNGVYNQNTRSQISLELDRMDRP